MYINRTTVLLARISLFIIYFWFGILKVIKLSPASGIVQELFGKTIIPMSEAAHIGSLSPESFILVFGIIEILIGIMFLIPRLEKVAVTVFLAHMITTGLPLFFLKDSVWIKMFVPTLEGQYIIKNLALITCALVVMSQHHKNETA